MNAKVEKPGLNARYVCFIEKKSSPPNGADRSGGILKLPGGLFSGQTWGEVSTTQNCGGTAQ